MTFLNRQVNYKVKCDRNVVAFTFCAISAFTVLLFATKNSPLYPFQDGLDANTFFSVGKSLFNGKVLYRDIYEHKGLILYLLYGCAYLFSHETFIGVFLIELICGTFTLWYAWKIVCLCEEKTYLFLLPVFGCALWSGDAFSYGGQPEELALPVLMWGLYTFLELGKKVNKAKVIEDKDFDKHIYELPLSKVFLCGLWTAVLFWVKYTLTGFFLGLVFIMLFVQIKRRNYIYLIKCAGAFVAGFMSVTIPVLIYFLINNALGDLWQVYFYNLIFRYNERDIGMSRFEYSLRKVLLTFWRNKRFSLMIVGGVIWFVIGGVCKKNEKKDLFTSVGLLVLCIVTTVSIYYSRQYNRYWGEVLAVFSVTGLVLANRCCSRVISGIMKKMDAAVLDRITHAEMLSVVLSIMLASVSVRTFGDNTYLLKYDREQMPQYIFKEIILERECGDTAGLKILNYGSLDLGLHTVMDNVPFLKYFCDCNIILPELYDAQDNALINGEADYVICLDPIDVGEDRYELIKKVPFEMEWENYYRDYYLYGLKK